MGEINWAIPLHLWGKNLFKKVGDHIKGFVALDEDMKFQRDLQ